MIFHLLSQYSYECSGQMSTVNTWAGGAVALHVVLCRCPDASPVSALQPADETAGGSSFTVDTSLQAQLRGCMEECTLGPTILIDDATDEGIFYTEVLVAVQRWFSSQGWPTGPHPVIIPDTLRRSDGWQWQSPLPRQIWILNDDDHFFLVLFINNVLATNNIS